jgi:hypothetical protein
MAETMIHEADLDQRYTLAEPLPSEHGRDLVSRLAVGANRSERAVVLTHYGLHLTPSEALVLSARLREAAESILTGAMAPTGNVCPTCGGSGRV